MAYPIHKPMAMLKKNVIDGVSITILKNMKLNTIPIISPKIGHM